MSTSTKSPRRVDVVILTAIELEYKAVLDVQTGALAKSEWEPVEGLNGLPVAFRSFAAKGGRPLRVAVALAEDMGSEAATNALLPLVELYEPRCVAMCGVCAGHPDKTNLGDVIAAERLYFHDKGKRLPKALQQDLKTYNLRGDWKVKLERFDFASRFQKAEWWKKRPVPLEWQENWVLHMLLGGAYDPFQLPESEEHCPQRKEVIRSLRKGGYLRKQEVTLTRKGYKRASVFKDEYGDRFPDLSPEGMELPFRVHVAPMASGSQVIEDKSIWSFLSRLVRKTHGLEMEAAAIGLLAHAQRDRKLDAVVMKGVMDFANDGRDDHFKQFAARASAECLLAFLREHLEKEVIPGVDDLLLTGTEGELPEKQRPSALLSARYEVVPFHENERGPALQELEHWCNEEPAVAVRLLHAEGGVGKTRLAIEAIRRLWIEGWVAGFIPQGNVPEDWLERLWTRGQPVMVVVDYAESRPKEQLVAMLARMHRYAHARKEEGVALRRVRLLLLARNAGDWWKSVLKSRAELDAWLGNLPAHELEALAVKQTDREKVFHEGAKWFASKLGKKYQRPVRVALADERFKRVLYLHMAALATVEGLEFTANTLMKVILDHEEHFWAMSVSNSDARQVMAASTLRGGLPSLETARTVAQEVLRRPLVDGGEAWLRQLHRIYQREQEGSAVFLPGLEPDLLGEAMVLRVAAPELEEDIVPREWIDWALQTDGDLSVMKNGLEVLGRASAVAPEAVRPWIQHLLSGALHTRGRLVLEVAKAVGQRTAFSVIGEELWKQLKAHGDARVARELEEAGIPEETITLRHVAEWTTRTLLETLPRSEEDTVRKERARLLTTWGQRLSEVGEKAEALKASREAVELGRELARKQPETFQGELVRSLNGLGWRLSEVGRREEALTVAQEAVELGRELARKQPDAYQPDFARSLHGLGWRLSEVGKRKEALDAAQEAVELGRELARKQPKMFEAALGRGLHSLGWRLSEVGKREESLGVAKEAVDLGRELARSQPEALQPDLARSLHSLSWRLSEVGRREEALTVAQEAVLLARELARNQPEAFQLDLARTLHSLGVRLGEAGKREEALTVAQEAVLLGRALARSHPEALRPDLARSLNSLGVRLGEMGRREVALKAAQESVELGRELVRSHPEAFQPDLVPSLNSLSVRLGESGRWGDALKAAQEAVDLGREVVGREPEAFQRDLLRSLENLSWRLGHVGRREEALKVAQEAVELGRELTRSQPEAFQPDLARSLHGLGFSLGEVELREDALKAAQEAVELGREVVGREPEAFQSELALSLTTLGTRLSRVERKEEALKAAQEAVGKYQELAGRWPEALQPHLAWSLSVLGARLREVGRSAEALKLAEGAVGMLRELSGKHPEWVKPPLAWSLGILVLNLSSAMRHDEALKVAEEAVGRYRELAIKHPDEFEPRLADAIDTLGMVLSDLQRREEALIAFEEAVSRLWPFFEQFPRVFEREMKWMLGNVRAYYEFLQGPPPPNVQELMERFEELTKRSSEETAASRSGT